MLKRFEILRLPIAEACMVPLGLDGVTNVVKNLTVARITYQNPFFGSRIAHGEHSNAVPCLVFRSSHRVEKTREIQQMTWRCETKM